MNTRIQTEVRADGGCNACKLGDQATGLDNCVTAQGNDKADLLVVTAKPLGRKQREELDNFLKLGGIDLESVAYTAVNKCSVWDAKPGKADIRTCVDLYLNQEIALIKPKVILALGNEPLTATAGRSGIMKYRGQTLAHKATGIQVFATISPAMVARNPGQYDGFVADMKFVNGLLTGVNASDALKPKAFRYVMSGKGLKLLAERLKVCEGYSFDIETNGFDEFKPDSKIVTLSLTTWMPGEMPSEVWVIPLYHPESPFRTKWRQIITWLWPFLKLPKKRIAHNGKFDLRWLRQFKCRGMTLTFDTMLAAHLLDENRPKGLKPLARTLLGVAPWEMDTRDLLNEPLRKVMKYNGLDTWYTAHIYFILRDQLVQRPRLMKIMKYIMVPASNAFTEIEMKGIWVDTEKLSTNSLIAKRTLDDINEQLMQYVPDKSLWPANIKEVNFNASNFARWWLFDYLELPVLGRGKDKEDGSPGAPSMAEGLMQRLAKDYPHPAIDLLLERVKWQKFHSSFFTAYQEQIDERDRIHTTFKLTGTVTGRLSSGKGDDEKVTGRVQNRGVNLQQVPRDKFVKGIFGGPPGYVFLECDYSQVELRIAAFIADEPTMKHLYATNQDIHMATAMKMTNKEGRPDLVTKEERKKAKPVNFGFLYGMSASTFITTAWNNYGVEVTEEEAVAFRKAFFTAYPKLLDWHKKQRRLGHKYGRVESPLGRIRHLPDIHSADREVRGNAERQAINSPVQSFASDMAIIALITLTREFRKRGLRSRSVGTVHDAINFEVPIEELPIVAPLIKQHMENPPVLEWFGVHLDIPIVGDVALSRMWGDKEEIDGAIISDPVKWHQWLKDHDLLVPSHV
jgi:uracil-DNA glycosylase family 4